MILSDIYRLWLQYIATATGYAANKVIIRHQSYSPPQKPFIDVHITNIKKNGTPIVYAPDVDTTIATLSMTATIEIRSFSDVLIDSETALFDIIDSFDTQLQNDIFDYQIGYRGIEQNVISIPTTLNNQQESQSILSVKFGFNRNKLESMSFIETTDITYHNN